MAKIIAPNTAHNGITATLPFVNGVAETEDKHLIAWFKNQGYEVQETARKGGKGAKKEELPGGGDPDGGTPPDAPPAEEPKE